MTLFDTARAKVNLTLRVLGRRSDGYHALESLVAFALFGDELSLTPGGETGLEVAGPFADALGPGDDNLVLQAAEAVLDTWPEARSGAFRLTKNLPVAAGLGGGSADAAAALRLLMGANPDIAMEPALARTAVSLGADVNVCLEQSAAMMRGIGENVEPVTGFPSLAVVLANPRQPVATPAVFEALRAPPVASPPAGQGGGRAFGSGDEVVAFIRAHGNDLEAPAVSVLPVIADVKTALAALDGCQVAGLSGSGATCFGLFATQEEAETAAGELAAARPDWWVVASTLV